MSGKSAVNLLDGPAETVIESLAAGPGHTALQDCLLRER
jgi:hypothetical protein